MNSQNREQEIFSRLIRELRSDRNLSQREFSQLFAPRVTYQAIGQWERGEAIPARKYWKAIAELAEMELGQFYEYVGMASTPASSLIEDITMKIKSLTPNELKEVIEVTLNQSSLLSVDTPSASSRHLAILKKGKRAWNKWRDKNPNVIPQLSGVNLSGEISRDLSEYNLNYANLARVSGSSISFENAQLASANFEGAELDNTVFSGAYLAGANLKNIKLDSAWLMNADLERANLQEANLRFANFENANMYMANLNNAEGIKVNFAKAFLKKANLNGIILVNSIFNEANLNEATLEKANLNDCSVYGVSLWGTKANDIILNDVYISPKTKESPTINNLLLAPTLDLHRSNPSITKRFIQICQMEDEVVKLTNILIKKYCEYSQVHGFRICSNIEQKDSKTPYCEIRETNNTYLFVRTTHHLRSGFYQKEIHEPRTILVIDDGIIKSNLKPEDIELLKGMLEFEEKTQKQRVRLIAPIVIKILDFLKSDKFVDNNYTLERNEREVAVVTNSEAKIEQMRVKLEDNQWQIINSSLSKNNCKDIQNILEKLEKSSTQIE